MNSDRLDNIFIGFLAVTIAVFIAWMAFLKFQELTCHHPRYIKTERLRCWGSTVGNITCEPEYDFVCED